ncbi:MAG TPA: sulfite exporter TauE/SafE family protein [Pontiella sp.]|nr:sulfite exporter TauE/SafE family protein [Pontiella sp.]
MEFLDLTVPEVALRVLLGMVIGFCIGLTGVGGGVLVLPALTLILRIDPITAVGTTTLYAFLTKITAVLHHCKLKTIDWGISKRFLMGAVPANIITAVWVSRQGGDVHFKQALTRFIVGVVFFSVFIMVLNMVTRSRPRVIEAERELAEHIQKKKAVRIELCILLGAICGGLIGATSIGGGVLIVPMLIILFGLPAPRTVGTAIFIAFILTMLTSLIYGSQGEQDRLTAVIMAAGSLAGVYYGSKLSVKLPELFLRTIVVVLVLVAAIMMLGGSVSH